MGEEEGQHYYSMPLIEGGTLADRQEELQDDFRSAVALVVKVARAVHFAHQNGILHRDLKPRNILVDREGEPQVVDFGLAREIESDSSRTVAGQILGTPSYMAPEQIDNAADSPPTTAVDVYALGAILYHLLTGEPPFTGDHLVETLRLVVEKNPASPRERNPRIDRDLERIVLGCLEKAPTDRYPSASALATDLERWLRGEPVLARPIPPAQRLVKWARRNPLLAALWAVPLLGVVGLGIGGPLVARHQARLRVAADEARDLAEERAEENLQSRYFSEMNMASFMGPAELPRIREITSHWIPAPGERDRRGWEWHYLDSLGRNEMTSFTGHGEQVLSAAWHPNKEWVASSSREGGLVLWRVGTGAVVADWKSDVAVEVIRWSPDGSRIAGACRNGDLLLWRPEAEPEPELTECSDQGFLALAWGPESRRVAVGTRDGRIRSLEMETREWVELAMLTEPISSLDWSPDGSELAVGTDYLKLFRIAVVAGEASVVAEPEPARLRHLAWSPDGRSIAGESLDYSLSVVDAATGEERVPLIGHYRFVKSVDWNPVRPELLASSSWDRTIRIWDTEAERVSVVLPTLGQVHSVSWSGDGTRVVFGDGKTVRICDALSPETPTLGAPWHWVGQVAWHPEDPDRFLSVSGDRTIRIWNRSQPEEEVNLYRGHGKGANEARWHPDGNFVASVSEELHLWQPETGETIRKWTIPGGKPASCAWSPDGELIATLTQDGIIRIWNAATGTETQNLGTATENGPGLRRAEIQWSHDGDRLAILEAEDSIAIWSPEKGKKKARRRYPGDRVLCLAWHPSIRILAVGFRSGGILIYRFPDSRQEPQQISAHSGPVESLAWSPDGTRLASGGADRMLRVWDPDTGATCLTLAGHEQGVAAVDWSPDGARILSGSPDMTLRIWESRERSTD